MSEELSRWYEELTYADAKDILREKLMNLKMNFIAAGYYLKYIRDNELYLEDGYASIWEFAEDNYGIQKSTASRWMKMNDRFSEGGNTPILAEKYKAFGKSQLQEMLYLEDDQIDQVTPDMTVREIREVRTPEEVEEEPVSILGYPLRIYPEGSLIATPGCGKQDCFSCHRDGCELRQVDCYCVEAPMGNPFPCSTLNIAENLREEIGSKCQFVNSDLAFHRAGDGQPVPCCKECDHPCGYECNRSIKSRCKDVCESVATSQQNGTCIHRPEFSCTLPEASKLAVGDGIDCNKKCCWDCPKRVECGYRCNSASGHLIEEQIPGQMSVEDFPDFLPDQKKTDIDINNVEDNDVIKQPENVINPPESVTEDDGNAIDAEYKEIAAESTETEEICCQKAADLDELTFSQVAIRDYLEEEERTLAEYEKVNSEDGGLPLNLMMRQRMLVKGLRLLSENEADHDDQEDDEPEEIETVQPELPVLRNNEQRKEWLNNYKEWPVWFEVPEAAEVYHIFNLPDGSSIVICEYHVWLEWKESYTDENPDSIGTREYLLKPGYRYLQNCRTNTSALVEHLKNLQKGEKK